MADTPTGRRRAGSALAVIAVTLLWPVAHVAASGEVVEVVDVSDTNAAVESTEPTDPPAETDPPASSEPVEGTADPGTGSDESDDADGTVALIAVIGFSLVLVLESWWMVRRGDHDDKARPSPPDTGDAPGSDLI